MIPFKVCRTCDRALPIDLFYPNKNYADKRWHSCKGCDNKRRAADDRKNPEAKKARQRKADLKHLFSMTPAQYDQLLASQSGRCANPDCGAESSYLGHRLCVDHDRKCCPGSVSCGKCVRALLCRGCNIILGHAKDRPDRLRGLANYLERFE